ncbi:MAG TPA: serine hydrolase domain-containing protein [Terricaulis sp.]|nr:serine hydrolase domain-containing protein [Terricaulis sp.]
MAGTIDGPQVSGKTDPAFARVREVFEAHFQPDATLQEVGAAVAVCAGRRCVVDLWGGVRSTETKEAWTPDTLVNVWSTTKGIMAIAVAQLVAAGKLDYAAPVARYWPEFAAAGKDGVTVEQVMSHQAGLNGFAEPTTVEDFGDWETVTARLAVQAPLWPPGEKNSYHAMTYGFLAGEIARRASGLMPRELIAQTVAGPINADFQIGVAEADWTRTAPLIPPPRSPADAPTLEFDPLAAACAVNPQLKGSDANRPEWRRAQIPAGNGHATARALATIYGELGGALLSPAGVEAMTAVRTTRDDLLLGPGAWAAGMMINRAGLFGPGPRAYGHCGWGGSYGYADPDLKIAVGYTPNRMNTSVLQDPRGMALAAAVAECAGRAGS